MDAVNTNINGTRQAESPTTGLEIAIIGMAGRFPGARDLRQFWENLLNGTESISFFSEEELLAAGIPGGRIGLRNLQPDVSTKRHPGATGFNRMP